MATIQEQYTELLKRGQDDALAALKAWNRTLKRTLGQLPTTGLTSAEQVIDEFYGFAGHVLDAQREFAKQFIATSTAAVEKVRDGLAETAEAVGDKPAMAKAGPAKAAAH